MPLTFYIETFGCQMNKGDSDLMHLSMTDNGFVPVSIEDEADIVIFNTCSVRHSAEKRAIARIRMAKSRLKNTGGTVVVAGCMAQRTGHTLVDDRYADLVIGTYSSPNSGEIISSFLKGRTGPLHLGTSDRDFVSRIDAPGLERRDVSWHEWVTITHGCENHCTYCIVPYVRGKLVSFRSADIIDYVKKLAERNVKEVSLLGQNVNQYGQDSGDIQFWQLLEKVSLTEGIKKINFLTSHPKDFSPEIVRVIRDSDNISPAIHLPLQSGSNRILDLMNRGYSLADYMHIVDHIRETLPVYSISTDLIVGFPGEDEDDYQATLDAVRDIRFDEAYMYAYSPRSGTPAAEMKELLQHEEKINRLRILIDTQRSISSEKMTARIGSTDRVFVERVSRKSRNHVMGRTFLNHPVVLPGTSEHIGKRLEIKITGIKGSTLLACEI